MINKDRNSVFCVVNFRRIFILQVGNLPSRYNEYFSRRDSRTAIFSRFDISNYDIPSEATCQILRVEVATPGNRRVWGCVPEQRRIEARTGWAPPSEMRTTNGGGMNWSRTHDVMTGSRVRRYCNDARGDKARLFGEQRLWGPSGGISLGWLPVTTENSRQVHRLRSLRFRVIGRIPYNSPPRKAASRLQGILRRSIEDSRRAHQFAEENDLTVEFPKEWKARAKILFWIVLFAVGMLFVIYLGLHGFTAPFG